MPRVSALLAVVAALAGCAHPSASPQTTTAAASQRPGHSEALVRLSRQKWSWMADRNMSELEALFHPSARFVHMGATMDRQAELDVISTGRIQ